MLLILLFFIIGGTIISVSNSPIDYSLIGNITCTGQEDSITQCTIIEEQSTDECQYCTDNIIGIKCFGITIISNNYL